MDRATQSRLRALPSVEEVVSHAGAADLLARHPRTQVVEAVRGAVDAARREIIAGPAGEPAAAESPRPDEPSPLSEVASGAPAASGAAARAQAANSAAGGAAPEPAPAATQAPAVTAVSLLRDAAALLAAWAEPGLRRVMNLTGVVVHTNLGRSALADVAVERVAQVARGYSNLEYDLESGGRGSRETYVERLLTRVTGAEAAFAVNNNAGAVLLLLMALAGGREVIVSRGQLVEIGGSFRIPDIIRAGGVRLVEVGTTNRTRIEDYEAAIGPDTAMLLRVHTSNYRILGFTQETELEELVGLGRRNGLVVADDLGSGALLDLTAFRGEPNVADSLNTGADVVCFSGDKLLGGPQAGILVGRAEVVDRLRKHPVARALRLDKMTLAALEATLELYRDPERARAGVPTLRYLSRAPHETEVLAAALQTAIECRLADGFILEVEESSARAGGGSMPLVELPSHAVRIRFPDAPAANGLVITASVLDAELRRAPLPVVARVAQDCLHLDVIALDERDIDAVAESLAWAIDRVVSRTEEGVK